VRQFFIVPLVLAFMLFLVAVPAAAAAPNPGPPVVALQTPAPETANASQAVASGSPWLAVIVFLGVAAFVVWKTTHPVLSQPIKNMSCMPVIDEVAEARVKAKIQALEEKEAREARGS